MTEPPPTVAPGSRIRLIAMGDDPDPIPVGAEGTVIDSALIQTLGADPYEQVTVAWDNGRSHHGSGRTPLPSPLSRPPSAQLSALSGSPVARPEWREREGGRDTPTPTRLSQPPQPRRGTNPLPSPLQARRDASRPV